mgnify:CR=1 FL=1
MANTEIFLRNIFGTTRPNIRPLVLALNITNDLLFEQHISMSDIKATKHIYPDVARLLHKKPETVYKSVIRLAHRCWDALVEQDLVATVYKGNIIKNLIMDCQSYTKYRPNETTGGIFVSWRRKEELPTGA